MHKTALCSCKTLATSEKATGKLAKGVRQVMGKPTVFVQVTAIVQEILTGHLAILGPAGTTGRVSGWLIVSKFALRYIATIVSQILVLACYTLEKLGPTRAGHGCMQETALVSCNTPSFIIKMAAKTVVGIRQIVRKSTVCSQLTAVVQEVPAR